MMEKAYLVYNQYKKDIGLTCNYQKALQMLEGERGGFIEVVSMKSGNVIEVIQYKDVF